jgi:hypothetical protein
VSLHPKGKAVGKHEGEEVREEQVYQQGEANYVKAKKVPKFVEFPESHTALDGYRRRNGEPLAEEEQEK